MTTKISEETIVIRDLRFFPFESQKPKLLSPAQIQHYNTEGYVFPLDLFTPEEVERNRVNFERLMAKAEAHGYNRYSINCWQHLCPDIYDLANESRILDYVEDLLGPNFVCWATHFFSKQAGDTKRVSWHQDASYWSITPSKTVTVWMAIDDADVENGAMRVIPRSHLHGEIKSQQSIDEEQNVLDQSVPNAESYGEAPVLIELKAGQISLHSDLLLHGSEPNPSSRRRCGLTMRFCPIDVHEVVDDWVRGAILVRGEDPSGHWSSRHRARPECDTIPDPRSV